MLSITIMLSPLLKHKLTVYVMFIKEVRLCALLKINEWPSPYSSITCSDSKPLFNQISDKLTTLQLTTKMRWPRKRVYISHSTIYKEYEKKILNILLMTRQSPWQPSYTVKYSAMDYGNTSIVFIVISQCHCIRVLYFYHYKIKCYFINYFQNE